MALDPKLPANAEDWQASWEGSRRFQIRHWASLSLEQKLGALEEMSDYAREADARWQQRHAPRPAAAQHPPGDLPSQN